MTAGNHLPHRRLTNSHVHSPRAQPLFRLSLNEAHHMTHEPIVTGKHSYLYMGGLISANIFRCDVTNPHHIPTCPLVTKAKDVTNFSGIDDFSAGSQRQRAGHL